jgi:hypothetical protein
MGGAAIVAGGEAGFDLVRSLAHENNLPYFCVLWRCQRRRGCAVYLIPCDDRRGILAKLTARVFIWKRKCGINARVVVDSKEEWFWWYRREVVP